MTNNKDLSVLLGNLKSKLGPNFNSKRIGFKKLFIVWLYDSLTIKEKSSSSVKFLIEL